MVSKTNIDKAGAKAVAKDVMEQLKDVPAGRRTIYINNNLMPKTLCGERIWWDEGVVKTKEILGLWQW